MTTIVAGSLPLDMTTPGYFFANDAASVLSFSSSLIVVGAPDGTTEYYSGSFAFTYVPSAGGYELSGGVLTGLADYAPLGLVWSASGFAVSYDTYFGFAARNDANGLRQYILDQSSDTVTGSTFSDTLVGGQHDDTITGGGGNDVIDGGSGIDTAAYSGLRSQYTVTASNGHVVVTDRSGADGTDTLANVERLRFADAVISVSPVATGISRTAGRAGVILASSLVAVDDALPVTRYQFWDGNADPASGHFALGGPLLPAAVGTPLPAQQAIDVTADQLPYLSFQTGSGSDTLWVRAYDGASWGNWASFSVTAPADHAPTVTALNPTVHGGTVAAASLFGATDADGDAIVAWDLWDPIAGNGNFVVNGVAQAARQELDWGSGASIGWDTTGESGPTVIAVRAFDGVLWSDWTNVTVNLREEAPVVTATAAALHGGVVAAATLFGATDADGDAITAWDLWDPIAGNGTFTVNGVAQAARQELTLASLAGVAWDATGETGPTIIGVRAFDGARWSDWSTVTINITEHAPVASGLHPAVHGGTVAAASLFAASDADGDAITQWELWDPLAGDGGFTINGAAQAARQVLSVSDLTGLAWDTTGETGSTVVAVRAFDGFAWSDWTTVDIDMAEHAPVVAGLNAVVHGAHQVAATSLFGASDADSDAITQWDLWDPIEGNGGFTINGAAQAARQELLVSSLAGLAWDTGGESGAAVIGVRAFDGARWSDWTSVAIDARDAAPVVHGLNPIVDAGPVTPASLFAATDADGDAITAWDLWDPIEGSGGFTLNGQAQPARHELTVSDLAAVRWDTTGQSGATAVAVRAFDGSQWSDWTSVTIPAPLPPASGVVSNTVGSNNGVLQLVQANAGTGGTGGIPGNPSITPIADPVPVQPVLTAALHG